MTLPAQESTQHEALVVVASVTSTARERLGFDYIKGEVRRERY